MGKPEEMSAEAENRHHAYVGTRIPWYVRLLWLLFWIFAIYYTLAYAIPAIQESFTSPK